MRSRVLAFALFASTAAIEEEARANGAFPDSFSIFAPKLLPNTILLGTNFGVLFSEDDGLTWSWTCEAAIAPFATLYQVGPPPDHTMFAVSWTALAVSRDRGCTWEHAGSSLANKETIDSFPDPGNPLRILALARPKRTSTAAFALHGSFDGGRTFQELEQAQPEGARLQSVEISLSDSRRIYMTSWADLPPHPYLLRSEDNGATFDVSDLEASLGRHVVFIAAIDPEDADTLYFRVLNTSPSGDSLGISRDGGRTAELVLDLPVRMTAFLRRSDGALLVGSDGADAHISRDGGRTFEVWSTLVIQGLAERDGAIYAATDNFRDGAAAAITRNDGATWEKLPRYEDALNPRNCNDLANRCQIELDQLRILLETPPPPPPPPPPDAGSMVPTRPAAKCTCTSVRSSATHVLGLLLILAALAVVRLKR